MYYLVYGYLNLTAPEEISAYKQSIYLLKKKGIPPKTELGQLILNIVKKTRKFFTNSKNQLFGDSLKIFSFGTLNDLHVYLNKNNIKKEDYHVFKVIKGVEKKIIIEGKDIKEESLLEVTKKEIEAAIIDFEEMGKLTPKKSYDR